MEQRIRGMVKMDRRLASVGSLKRFGMQVLSQRDPWSLRAPLVFLLVLLMALACVPEGGVEGEIVESPEDFAANQADLLLASPLTSDNLAPRFSTLGFDGAVDQLAVVFSRSVVAAGKVKRDVAADVELQWLPEVEGSVRYTDASTLLFTPSAPFSADTVYTVRLVSINTVAGRLEAEGEKAWSFSFETPGAHFRRLVLKSFEPERRMVEVALRFSGAVDPKRAAAQARFTLVDKEGRQRKRPRVRLLSKEPASEISFQLSGAEVVSGRGIRLKMAGTDGLLETGAIELPGEELLDIKTVYLEEGPSGFHLEVVCDDSAVEGRRWFWDAKSSRSWQISSRCELDSGFLSSVVIEPYVQTKVVASAGGFRLLGNFERGVYRVRLEAGARSLDGGVSRKTTQLDVRVPARAAQLAFTGRGRYLARDAWRSLGLRHLNLAKATLEVRHVPPESLAFWLSGGDEATDERNSHLVAKTTLALDGALDEFASTQIDPSASVPAGTKGLLQITVSGAHVRATSRLLLTDMLLIAKRTGIGRVTEGDPREWGTGVAVWALDADSLAGLRGVTVRVLRRSGEALGTCLTGRNGGCEVQLDQGLDPSPPFAVVAQSSGDFSYIAFDELRAEVQEARVAGVPFAASADDAGYAAVLYTERGVYRPGDTAHIAAVLRNLDGSGLQQTLPVALKLFDPRGKLFRERALVTNAVGFLTDDVSFADFAVTGRYEAVIEVADKVVARQRFQVEEFVPERLEVHVKPPRLEVLARDGVEAQVDARYLFGGTPAGATVQLGCELQPARFAPVNNAEYVYGPWQDDVDKARPLQLGETKAELDSDGVAHMSCPSGAAAGALLGTAKAILRAAVSEAGSGRATVGRAEILVHPAPYYVGLKSGIRKLGPGDNFSVEGLVVDWQGKPVNTVDSLRIEFVRLEREWGRFYDQEQGRDVYRSYRRPLVEEERTVSIKEGRFAASFSVAHPASGYLVRVLPATEGPATVVSATDLFLESRRRYYYWAPRESQRDLTPRPGRARWIALEVPAEVSIDERFEIHFDAPFSGRVLLTLETDQVIVHEWRDVEAGAISWKTKLGRGDVRNHHASGFVPNVYASAFVIKDPHLESKEAFLPDRALGVASIGVLPAAYAKDPKIEAPSEVRSNSALEVVIDLGPEERRDGTRFATVAAVDEGILSLTQFTTPDPLEEIFPRRALGVETFETVGWTMAQWDDPSSSTGGDQSARGPGRVAPVRPVALWSGLREVPPDGRLKVTFNVPEYRGALRIMAVSASGRRVGSSEQRVLVRDPLLLQTTLPRFLVRGDTVEVPVFVTNLSTDRQNVEVELTVESIAGAGAGAQNPVEVQGPSRQSLQLDQDVGAPLRFLLKSTASSGAVRVRVRATAGDLVSVESLEVPLQSAGPKVRRTERLVVRGPDAVSLRLQDNLRGWEPGSETTTLWLARNRFADVYEHLGFLLRYPYGCLEQTTTSTRPLLSLRELMPFVGSQGRNQRMGGEDLNIDQLVQQGVDRILSMQTPEGGFSYWPGGDRPAYWASAYAADFLLDAAKERFDVPKGRLEQVLQWMEREVGVSRERLRDGYSDNGAPYIHFVLAKGDRGKPALILRALEDLEARYAEAKEEGSDSRRGRRVSSGQFQENRFLLQAALYLAGDHRFEAELRNPAYGAVEGPRSYGWSFYSDRRRRGLMLSIAVDLFGNQGAGTGLNPLETLAQTVAAGLRGRSRGYTTQELIWGLTGLSKYSQVGDNAAIAGWQGTPELWVDGVRWEAAIEERGEAGATAEGDEATRSAPSNWSWTVSRASQRRTVELRVPALGDTELFLQVSSSGVRTGDDQPGPGASGLMLQRYFRRADGALFDPSAEEVTLGEVVTVELRLENRTGEKVTNLALTDRLASGFEIENPRLGRGGDGSAAPWLDRDLLWSIDHLEIRDDRLEVFGALDPGQKVIVVYAARATAAGEFSLPMPTVEAMYNPEVWARAAASRLSVAR